MNKKPVVKKFLHENQKDYHQQLTEDIIKKMKESVEYEKPWFSCVTFPYNPVTKTKYQGVNVLALMVKNYEDPRWLTYNNVVELSKKSETPMHIIKGEKGTPIFKAVQRKFPKTDDPKGEETFSFWQMVYAGTVFNAAQIEGLPALEKPTKLEFETHEEVEKITTAMKEKEGLKISYGSTGASYDPPTDTIYMPPKENFKSAPLYYRTLMHELGHATGNEKRLNRNLQNKFGSDDYAFEELVAELSSYFIGAIIGLPYDSKAHDNHAAYVKGWIEQLSKDKNTIFRAASKANKATNFLIETKKAFYGETVDLNENELHEAQETQTPKIKP